VMELEMMKEEDLLFVEYNCLTVSFCYFVSVVSL
jgi:hypothetical protein